MPDAKQIADEIRSQLAAIAQGGAPAAGDDALADLAATYAELCQEVNRRLRRCNEYLARGLRSEAVDLAQCPPALIDAAEALEFDGRKDWMRLCAARQIPVPPPPNVDLLPAIRSAIGEESRLAPLTGRHRVLALAREPLTERLTVLRQIAQTDPAAHWKQQIVELETARLREMRDEAKAAFRGRQTASIASLHQEMAQTPWQADVPPDLRAALQKANDLLRLESSMHELRAIAQELVAAQAANDYETGRASMSRWQEIVNARQLTIPPELQGPIRTASTWLAAEDRRQDVRQKLRSIQPVIEADEKSIRRNRPLRLMRNLLAILALAAAVAATAYWLLHNSFH